MKIKHLPSLLLTMALSLATSTALADDLAQIKAAGAIKFGTEGTYPPFTYHDANGKLVGFDVELAQAIAKRLGVKAQSVEGKWDGLIAGLDVKRYDAVINEVGITPQREAKYDFSDPYIVSKAALIVRNDNTTIKSFADLKGKKSANTLTSNFGKIAQTNGAELVPVQGFNDAMQLLLSGRVDATVNDNVSYLDFKKRQPQANVKVVSIGNNADASGILLRKNNPQLRDAINTALSQLKADGGYQQLSRKYFSADVSK